LRDADLVRVAATMLDATAWLDGATGHSGNSIGRAHVAAGIDCEKRAGGSCAESALGPNRQYGPGATDGPQLSARRQTVEQLAAGQDQMAREIEKLQAADLELLGRIPTGPRQVPAVPGRKPVPLPSSRGPIPPQ